MVWAILKNGLGVQQRETTQEVAQIAIDEALIAAAELAHLAAVETLLKGGIDGKADVQYRNWQKEDAMMVAKKKGHTAIIECLTRAGHVEGQMSKTSHGNNFKE